MKDFIVEINPSNDLIVTLNKIRKVNPKLASLGLKQLYETGLMQSGIPFNNKDMIKRNYKILTQLFENITNTHNDTEGKVIATERLSEESLKDFDEIKKSKNNDLFSDFKMKEDK